MVEKIENQDGELINLKQHKKKLVCEGAKRQEVLADFIDKADEINNKSRVGHSGSKYLR